MTSLRICRSTDSRWFLLQIGREAREATTSGSLRAPGARCCQRPLSVFTEIRRSGEIREIRGHHTQLSVPTRPGASLLEEDEDEGAVRREVGRDAVGRRVPGALLQL